jgi:flagellar basal-body rod modification protein FlgD
MLLLVTQLQYQDPLEPQSATEFTAQLATFSSLEEQTKMNDALEQITSLQAALANVNAASFIGKDVTAIGDTVNVQDGEFTNPEIYLDSNATSVKVTIRNASGSTIRVIEYDSMDAGTHTLDWDGKDASGAAVSDGEYTVSVEALADDTEVYSEVRVTGLVEGVEFDLNGTFLIVGGSQVALTDIISVSQPSSTDVSETSTETETETETESESEVNSTGA